MARLSEEKIQLIKETYKKVGTYSATAKIVGSSPATVKKYVTEDEPTKSQCEKIIFSKEIPNISEICWIYEKTSRPEMTILSSEELVEVEQLRKEI